MFPSVMYLTVQFGTHGKDFMLIGVQWENLHSEKTYQLLFFSHSSEFQKQLYSTIYTLNHLLNKHYKFQREIHTFPKNHIKKSLKCISMARQNTVNIILEVEKAMEAQFSGGMGELKVALFFLAHFFSLLLPSYIYFSLLHSVSNMLRLCLRTLTYCNLMKYR